MRLCVLVSVCTSVSEKASRRPTVCPTRRSAGPEREEKMEEVQRRLAEGKYAQAAKACEQMELEVRNMAKTTCVLDRRPLF